MFQRRTFPASLLTLAFPLLVAAAPAALAEDAMMEEQVPVETTAGEAGKTSMSQNRKLQKMRTGLKTKRLTVKKMLKEGVKEMRTNAKETLHGEKKTMLEKMKEQKKTIKENLKRMHIEKRPAARDLRKLAPPPPDTEEGTSDLESMRGMMTLLSARGRQELAKQRLWDKSVTK